MKKQILLLLAILSFGFSSAQTVKHRGRVKIGNTPAAATTDNVVAIKSNGLIVDTGVDVEDLDHPVENVAFNYDAYLGERVRPTDTNSSGFFHEKDINGATGYWMRNPSTGNAAYAGFVASGAGGIFDNGISMQYFSPNYFGTQLAGKGSIYSSIDAGLFLGRNTLNWEFMVTTDVGPSSQNGKVKASFDAAGFKIHGAVDDTKIVLLGSDNLTTATTRTQTFQDKDGVIALLGDTDHEGYFESGTRDAAVTPLTVRIGDYDSSNGGTYMEIDDDNGEVYFTGDVNTANVTFENGANGVSVLASTVTGTHIQQLQDKAGTIALTSDIVTYSTKVTLSSAQILALNTTPIQLVAAPGAGKAINVISVSVRNNFGTTAYSSIGGLEVISASGSQEQAQVISAFLNSASSTFSRMQLFSHQNVQIVENDALNITVGVSDPTLGDGTVDVYVTYEIINL